eukprot:TRINITY_DN9478_c0_g1_i3.p1 TRINITY_DN9478_c0_g1~~TRINITY_DN9478_c0_g1_i3.p1  ORF type:complete len:318 (-),score=4.17 TRINITY_DN9478_c0_g1_i3:56-1009(-)
MDNKYTEDSIESTESHTILDTVKEVYQEAKEKISELSEKASEEVEAIGEFAEAAGATVGRLVVEGVKTRGLAAVGGAVGAAVGSALLGGIVGPVIGGLAGQMVVLGPQGHVQEKLSELGEAASHLADTTKDGAAVVAEVGSEVAGGVMDTASGKIPYAIMMLCVYPFLVLVPTILTPFFSCCREGQRCLRGCAEHRHRCQGPCGRLCWWTEGGRLRSRGGRRGYCRRCQGRCGREGRQRQGRRGGHSFRSYRGRLREGSQRQGRCARSQGCCPRHGRGCQGRGHGDRCQRQGHRHTEGRRRPRGRRRCCLHSRSEGR